MRRTRIALALLLLGGLPVIAWTDSRAGAEDGAPTIVMGVHAHPRAGESQALALQRLEDGLGRQFAAVRDFLLWNHQFPSSFHTGLRDTGHMLLLSVKPVRTNGQRILWSDLADAPVGSALYNETVAWAQRMRDYGVPLYFTFHHEPETTADIAHGTAPQFIDAWRRVVTIFREQGATNVRFLWIMTDYSFQVPSSDRRAAFKWYPGDEWVDGLAADAYNWYTCREGINTPWRTLAQIIEGFRQFGLAHPSEEMWLAEWGGNEDPALPGRKAAWIAEAAALFKQPAYSQFRGLSYFHNGNSSGAFANCDWWLDTSQSALEAFSAMAADVFYQADPVPDVTPPDTSITSGPSGTVSTDTATFTFSSTEANSTFECAFDGANFALCDSPASYPGLADGPHSFEVLAIDPAGNADPSPATLPFVVDTSAPLTVIAFRAAAANGSPLARSSITINRPVGSQAGDILVAAVASRNDDPGFTAPAGWTLVRQDTILDSLRQAIYVKVAGAAEPLSYTWGVSTTRRLAGGITAYSGVDTANPIDVHGARLNTALSTAVTAPSVTTTVPDTLLVHFASVSTEGTISSPAGMIERWEATAPRANSTRDVTIDSSDAAQAAAGPTGTRTATTTQTGRSIGALLAPTLPGVSD